MDKSSRMTRTIVEVAIFSALGFVLDELQGAFAKAIFPFGGSIGIALIVVVIITFRRGIVAGFATGLIMGLLDFSTGPYILNFWQVLLDYIFPYAVVAICGVFRPWFLKEDNRNKRLAIILLATFVGGMTKFMSHFLSGGIFFADFISWKEFEGQPWLYSLAYNMAAVGPCTALSMILIVPLYLRAPKIIEVKEETKREIREQQKLNWFNYIFLPIVVAAGIFLFVFFLIKYIQSYSYYDDGGAFGIDFDPDAMMLFVTGLLLILIATISFIKSLKNNNSYRLTTSNIIVVTISNIIYPIARLIRLYIKGKDPTTYWIYLSVATLLLIGEIIFYIYLKKLERENTKETN